jgi:hypothetical protein
MKEIKKIIFLFMLVLYFQASFAQVNYLQVNLEIQTLKKENNNVRISLYQEDSVSFFLGIKNNPILNSKDHKTWLKRDADTIIKISKEDFDLVAEKVLGLSSVEMLKGSNPSNPTIGNDGIGVILEIVVTMDKISYSIWSPSCNTKERNLEPFLAICKEILLIAKMKPKDYF